MDLSDEQEISFSHPHLTGSMWPEPARHSFEERVAAVAAVGSRGMGMTGAELDALLKTRSYDSLHAVLAAHGVHIDELELVVGWNAEGEEARQGLAVERTLYRHAALLGSTRIKAAALLFPPAVLPPLGVLVERFAAMCDRAAEHGLCIALEPIALFPSFSYAVAADMVIAADRPNGGLLFDAWQTFRDPTGLVTLERVAARHVTGVELCDGYATPRGSLQDDCLSHRLLPGQGAFDLVRFVRTLAAKRVDVPLSVEVLCENLRPLTPREIAQRTVAAVRELLGAARAA